MSDVFAARWFHEKEVLFCGLVFEDGCVAFPCCRSLDLFCRGSDGHPSVGVFTRHVLFAIHIGTRCCVFRVHITCDIFRSVQPVSRCSHLRLFPIFCHCMRHMMLCAVCFVSFPDCQCFAAPACSSVVAQVLSRNSFVLDVSYVL